MHVLHFEADEVGKARFEYLYRGLIIVGNQNTQKGLSVLAREIAILDKLQAISQPYPCGKKVPGSDEDDRELTLPGEGARGQVSLDDPEFDLLVDYVSRVPWSIGKSSRGALACLAWLRSPSPTVP